MKPSEVSIVRGVIFDMDGVLCDSEPFICEAACRMFAETHGVTVRPEDFLPFVGTGENRYLGGVAARYGVTLELERDKRRTYDIYLRIIQGRLDPLPGAREFLAACRARGLKLAVATSADKVKLEGNLRQINLPPETFDVCVNGLDVTHKKPDPEIFLLAAKRLALPAAECVVVEDALNGIAAGLAAGARCLGLTTSFSAEELLAAGAAWTAPDLAHVPPDVLE
ncbi:MAG TPA: HAD family phosphatase [Phycisphaerales bacterium]|nr:HAD family phosphatase [Phycisphaerales bacterium]